MPRSAVLAHGHAQHEGLGEGVVQLSKLKVPSHATLFMARTTCGFATARQLRFSVECCTISRFFAESTQCTLWAVNLDKSLSASGASRQVKASYMLMSVDFERYADTTQGSYRALQQFCMLSWVCASLFWPSEQMHAAADSSCLWRWV